MSVASNYIVEITIILSQERPSLGFLQVINTFFLKNDCMAETMQGYSYLSTE